ncbi:YfbK domain-containing protein [Winogradskyella sp. A3E31]|uniref:vWA domain-containing protein n=1 Tax=Winogradskyella sp. A3E31 TaxID=3349637 RepID=UPI00398B6D0F
MKNLLQILVLLCCTQLGAQEKTINGIVTSASDNLPLPGVNIMIKGTSNGVQSDFDGNYEIKVKTGNILVFTYIGFTTEEIKVGKSNTINVAMQEDSAALDEVVIRGYSTINSRKIKTNIASKVYGSRASNSNYKQALSGQISGVRVKTKKESVNGNSPLFVVDGEVVPRYEFDALSVDKIKHIEILNALQGRAVYDYDGTKGVISVRTKGKKNVTDMSLISDFLNESYSQITENPFKEPRLSPLSTFSIDVDKAAYSNIRRMINNGQTVAKDAVKIEEMVNYFNYDYPQPTDEHPFSINSELIATPWNQDSKLVRIGIQGKQYKNEELPASNLTFLIDVSGSMDSPNKLGLLKSAFKLLVNQLRAKDKISIVVYAGAAGVVLEPTSGNNKEKILEALNNLRAGGSTAGGAGITLAYELAEKNFKKNGNNRVILATDGDFNVGASSDSDMQQLIEEKRKSGVFLSVLGFGYGNYKDSKLETLADKGNGNHAYIDTMQEAQKVFGKEFGGTLFTIAKDVKIQLEFNPKKVQAYRLIGYENRLLADADFTDDTKDAGELGSGHTVTALYEIIPHGVESSYVKKVNDLKYTTHTTSDSNELFTVRFRYKKPDEDKSIEMVHIQNDVDIEASEDTNFAAAVALFGMQLRQSQYDNESDLDLVLELAEKGKGKDEDGYRSEFIRLVKSYESLR